MKKLLPGKYPKFAFLLILFTILGFGVSAKTYYLSSSTGNDFYSADEAQNPATPWRTVSRLNIINFAYGDKVLFKRGDVFRGEIQVASGVTYGAYGTGNLPIISGAITITGWTHYKDNIYVASVSAPIKKLMINNKPAVVARYPNKGFLYFDKGISTTSFTDSEITQPSGYWVGADVRLSIKHWNNQVAKVTAQNGGTITYSPASSLTVWDGLTYYFDNKLSELDAENEYYFDKATRKVYLYAPKGVNPSTLRVEGTILDYAFKGGRNATYVTIQDLQIEKQAADAIFFYDGMGGNNTIINNRFYLQIENAISFMGNNTRVENNIFKDIDGRAIVGNASTNSKIIKNTISRIGMKIGYGMSPGTKYNFTGGIILGGATSNFLIAYNKLDSLGYIGIRPDGSHHIVERNIIKYTLINHADGAAIYAWGDITHNVIIRDNFIENPRGFAMGKPGHLAYGVYLDVAAHHCTITNNTIWNSNYGGILLNAGNHNNVISKNVCFNNAISNIKLDDWKDLASPLTNNTVSDNILYSTISTSLPLHLNSKFERYNMGTFDRNYYCNPYSDIVVKRSNYKPFPAYSISQWKTISGQDANTKVSPYKWNPCETVQVTGSNLLKNGTFTNDIVGWSFFNKSSSTATYVSSGIDGGSLKYTMTSNSPENGLVISPTFAGVFNQGYELKFSVKSTKSGIITAMVRQAHSPYAKLYGMSFPIDPTRANYRHVFKMPITDSQLRIDFEILYSSQNFTLDNVSLTTVNVSCHQPKDRHFLYTNPSDVTKSVSLGTKVYKDLNGNTVKGSISLNPWTSRILILDPSASTVSAADVMTLRTPENPTNTVNGLRYSYFEGNWATLPEFPKLTPVKKGIISDFNISLSNRADYFGFTYEGFISVPTDGEYTFYTNSDDGSKLFIGSTLIVDNDGRHAATEKGGKIGLKAGKHLIKVLYFENANGQALTVSYDGPGITKRIIPASVLYYQNTTSRLIDSEMEAGNELLVWPIPSQTEVTISSFDNQIKAVRIITGQGTNILSKENINSSELKLNVDKLNKGVYLLEVEYLSGEKKYKRLILGE